MLKIRRPLGRLIFNMGVAIPGKTVFLIETAPRWFPSQMAGNANNWLCHLRKYRRVTFPLPTTMLFTDIQAWLYTSHQCPLWIKRQNSVLHLVCYHHAVWNIILPLIVWYREAVKFVVIFRCVWWDVRCTFWKKLPWLFLVIVTRHLSGERYEAEKKRNCNCSQFKEARLWKVSVNTYCHHDKDLPFDHWNMVHRRRRKLLCFINDSTASHWIPLDTFCHKAFIDRVLITLKRGMNNGPQEIGLVTTNPEDRYAASVPMKSQWILLYVSWSVITWRLLSLMAAVVRWWPSVLCLFNGSIHKSLCTRQPITIKKNIFIDRYQEYSASDQFMF